MTERTDEHDHPAQPPARGEQDHDAMRAASMRPIAGPASTDTLAAGGGLELPGHERQHIAVNDTAPAHEPVPGERDPSTLTHRQPGAVSGGFAGADIPGGTVPWLDERTADDHRMEGGGKDGRHIRKEHRR